MDRRIMGVMFGVAAIILWFMPLVAWKDEFLGMSRALHQTGQHIGGIAYLLLAASIAYTALTWFNQHQLRIIAASVAMAISLLFALQAGTNTAWGLVGLFIASACSAFLAYSDYKSAKAATEAVA